MQKYTKSELQKIDDILHMKKINASIGEKERKKYTVKLEHNKVTGTGIVAQKDLRKGDVVAYFKMRVVRDSPFPDDSPHQHRYAVSLETRSEKTSSLIGDLAPESLPPAENNIPYFAYFSNEPAKAKDWNVVLDTDVSYNFANRKVLKIGTTVRYRLIASQTIRQGTAILWCYGAGYCRDIDSNDMTKGQYCTECSQKDVYE